MGNITSRSRTLRAARRAGNLGWKIPLVLSKRDNVKHIEDEETEVEKFVDSTLLMHDEADEFVAEEKFQPKKKVTFRNPLVVKTKKTGSGGPFSCLCR